MKRLLVTSAVIAALSSAIAAQNFRVYGEIGHKYNSLGGAGGFLGQALTDETGTPDGVGRYNHFQHGSIYWTPATGAHEVHGSIRDKWAAMGWERSFLGYPISDEMPMANSRGRITNFQGGMIVWSAVTGAHSMPGEQIFSKWIALRGSQSFLGFPTSDQLKTPDGVGRYVHFEGGSIYWSPSTGAHEVHGAIRDKWASLGWERGRLRFPRSDEYQQGAFRRSDFQGGFIRWSAKDGATVSVPIDSGTELNPVRE